MEPWPQAVDRASRLDPAAGDVEAPGARRGSRVDGLAGRYSATVHSRRRSSTENVLHSRRRSSADSTPGARTGSEHRGVDQYIDELRQSPLAPLGEHG
jgi:hypothetical protein